MKGTSMKIGKLFYVVKTFMTKNSPYILSGVGAASVAAGAVILVKKAKKQNEFDEEVETIYEERKQGIEVYGAANEIPDDQREKVYRKNIVKLNIWRVRKYVRYYTLPTILMSGGVMCMLSATLIQTKRLKALSIAYTSLATAFNDYREKVKEKFGEQEEADLREEIKRDKRGNIVGCSKVPLIENETTFSRLFGEGNTPFWSRSTNASLTFIKAAEGNLNERLRYQGFVTLNEVWDELGFKPSSEGMYLGWRFKEGDPVYGSTYISLGFCGPKNIDKCAYLKTCWDEDIWIEVVPPHVLFDKLPREKIRTEKEKKAIIENRKKYAVSENIEPIYQSDYELEKAITNKRNKMLGKYEHVV